MRKVLLMIVLIAMLLVTTGCFRIIDSGEVGVKKTLGKINVEELGDGLNFFIPVISFISVYDIKTQELKEVATVPSSEGLMIDLEISVLYKLQGDKAADMKIGVSGTYQETLLRPYIRSIIRDVVSGHKAEAVYSEEGRAIVEDRVIEELKAKLDIRGVIIEDVMLRNVKLPAKIMEAIEFKLDKEQEEQRKVSELNIARKDAEIKVAEARGIADANRIIAGSLTREYLAFRFIQVLAETDNQVIYVPTAEGMPVLTMDTTQ